MASAKINMFVEVAIIIAVVLIIPVMPGVY